MSEQTTETTSSSNSPSGGGGGKLVMIFSLVNLLVTLGMVAILFISFQKEKNKADITDIAAHHDAHGEGDAKAKDDGHGGGDNKDAGGVKKQAMEFGKMIALEQFTVNLTTPGGTTPKFIRVNISLEVPGGDAEAEVTSKMPQIRNAIIDLFNSKRPGDLGSAEGRDYVKEEIRNALNSFMVSGKVKGVFFTSFALSP